MARPKKKIDSSMTYLSESLEEIEHVSDRYYELFNRLAELDSENNPEEYYRIEAECEEEWDKSIRMKQAPAYKSLKAIVDDRLNGLRAHDREALSKMVEFYKNSEMAPFTEADWIMRCARIYSRKMLKAFKNKSDVEIEYEDVAQNAVLAILSAGKYDYMLPKMKKAAYIKSMVSGRFLDYTRSQKKYNERYSDQPYEDDSNGRKKKVG